MPYRYIKCAAWIESATLEVAGGDDGPDKCGDEGNVRTSQSCSERSPHSDAIAPRLADQEAVVMSRHRILGRARAAGLGAAGPAAALRVDGHQPVGDVGA